MPSNPLLSAGSNWSQRVKTFDALGIPSSVYQPVLQHDIQHVAQGHQGLSDAEAYTTIAAAHLHHSIVGEGKRPSLNPLANIAGDITGIVKALNPVSLARFAGHQVSDIGKLISGDLDPFANTHNPGQAIKAITQLPILNLIPGSYTLGNLATGSEGAREAAAHPVGSFLDILPLAGTALKATAQAGHLGSIAEVAPKSAMEAALAGKPLRAAYRSLPENIRGEVSDLALRKGLSSKVVDSVMRPMSRSNRQVGSDLSTLMAEKIQPAVGGTARRVSQAHLDKVAEIARSLGHFDDLDQVDFDAIRSISDDALTASAGAARLHGNEVIYNGEAYSIYNKWGPKSADNPRGGLNPLGSAQRALTSAQNKVMALRNQLLDSPDEPFMRLDDGSIVEPGADTPLLSKRQKIDASLKEAETDVATKQAQFDRLLETEVPLRAMPVIREQVIKPRALEAIQQSGLNPKSKLTMEEAAQQIASATDPNSLANILPDAAFRKLFSDPIEWRKHLDELGVNPILLPNSRKSSLHHMLHPKILSENNPSPEMFKDHLFNLTPVYSDVTLSLTEAARQALVHAGTEAHIRTNVLDNGVAKPKPVIMDDLIATYTRRGKSNPARAAKEAFDQTYRLYTVPKYIRDTLPPELRKPLYIDRSFLKAMETMEGKHSGADLPFKHTYDSANQVFRDFVLTSPRHLAHIALGGLLFMTLRKPMSLMEIPQIRNIAAKLKRGEYPSEITASLEQTASDSAGRYAYASTLGRLFSDIAGSPVRALDKVENWLVSMQKAMVFESELKGQIRKGVPAASASAAHELALKETLKTLIDMDAMTPAERTILKQVFPFYGFVRHQFRYLFTLPVDHPYRVAILTRFAEQEKEEWDTGLPQKLQSLWIFGPKDGGGGQWNLDAKTFNPFRTFGDMFAWSGFFQTLSPVISGPFNAAGFDTLAGTSELYPDSTYDPEFGTIVAKRPQGMTPRLLEQFIPQVAAVDHLLQFSDDMKGLKESSPEAYRNQLFSTLGIPFVRHKINLTETRAKTELRKFQVAQQAVTDAIRDNNPGLLDNYTVVPFNGRLVDADQLQAYIRQLAAEAEPFGVSPRAILPNSSKTNLAAVSSQP